VPLGKTGFETVAYRRATAALKENLRILSVKICPMHSIDLHCQNRRLDSIEAWWDVVNWDEVARRYAEAMK